MDAACPSRSFPFVLLTFCSLQGGQAGGDAWLFPAEGHSPLHAPFPGCSGGSAPFVPPSTHFREQDLGTGIVLYETVPCWYLQWPDVGFGSLGVPILTGAAVLHPLELRWGDGWGGRRGRAVAPQGQCPETRLGEYFIPRGDL